jgi:integrase
MGWARIMAAEFLQKRGNVWYFYRRVPLDLAPYVGRFWRETLRTSDLAEARVKARPLVVATDDQIAEERKKRSPLTPEDHAVIEDTGGLEALKVRTLGRTTPRMGFIRAKTTGRPIAFRTELSTTDEFHILSAASEMLSGVASANRANLLREGINPTQVVDDAKGASRDASEVKERLDRDLAILAKDRTIKLPRRPRVSQLDQFATSSARRHAARRFSELFPQLSLSEITRQHGVTFVKEFARLPSTPSPKIRPLPIQDAIAIADREKLPRVDRATVRQNFFRLSAMLNDAANEGLIKTNPLQGYRFPKAIGAKHAAAKAQRRKGFTPAELRTIDAASATTREYDRWVFLIGAYQGARREECAQLRVSDILQHNGLWCMQVTDAAEGQRVKNPQSVRLIPLHADLVARGFIEYVQRVDGDRLFPRLVARKSDQRISSNLGKRFSHLCHSLGIQKSFHSTRHTWKTAARNAGLPEDVAEAISGRKAGSGVGSMYGDLADPIILAPWLNKVRPFDDPAAPSP